MGFREITVIAGGGHKFTSRIDPENFSMGVRGEGGGGVPRHIFANLISLNFPEGEG